MNAEMDNMNSAVFSLGERHSDHLLQAVLVRWPYSEVDLNSEGLNKNDTLEAGQSQTIFYSTRKDLISVLNDASLHHPDRDLLLLHKDIDLPNQLQTRISYWLQQLPDAEAITVLSNINPAFNPFGLSNGLTEPPATANLDAMVSNTSDKRILFANTWPHHLLWIQADTARRLRQSDVSILTTTPERTGIKLYIADDIFARCQQRPLFEATPEYDWDMPPAHTIEYRQQSLHQLIAEQCWELPRIIPNEKPVILHISHSWGGGVARWVQDYCDHDNQNNHLILQSQGFWKNKQYGTHLSLHQLHPNGPQLAEWWLTPGIFSTDIRNHQYQEVLDNIQRCYAVSRVLISSLIGHSLEALRCPLPTIQVLHDYYPAWPLLSVAPGSTPGEANLADSMACIAPDEQEFSDRQAHDWQVLTRSWLHLLNHPRVRLVTPTAAARQQLLAINSAFSPLPMQVIGHGLRQWKNTPQNHEYRKQHSADKKLRVLVLGRLQKGKGRELLLKALPQLSNQLHITALGCGRDGQTLLGRSNVDVIAQYDWQDLPTLVTQIQPDVALLLSTVPETFSYTLSELRALYIPVIATRIGSFVERIEHGVTGLLIDQSSDNLVNTLHGLLENRIVLKQLQQRIEALPSRNMQDMLTDYQEVWQSIESPIQQISSPLNKFTLHHAQLLNYQRMNEWSHWKLEEKSHLLQNAHSELGKRLKHMRSQSRDITQLNNDIQAVRQALNSTTVCLRQTNQQLESNQQQLQQTVAEREHFSERVDMIVNSRSWKITKPLRLASRFSQNAKAHGAHNPRRWPALINKLRQRIHRNGWKKALRSLQEVPENHLITQPLDKSVSIAPVNWPRVIDAQGSTHVLLLQQSQQPILAALLNQLLEAYGKQPAEVHVLHTDKQPDIDQYLSDCNGIHSYSSTKTLMKTLGTAYNNGDIQQILLINGDLTTSSQSLFALLDTATQQPQAMLTGARSKVSESNHPAYTYSHIAKEISPELLLLRGSAVDGFIQSKFPKKTLTECLVDTTQLVEAHGGLIWQNNQACYQPISPQQAISNPLDTIDSTVKSAILIIDVWVPMPDRDSGSLRMVNLLRLLIKSGWHVVFCPHNKRHEGRYTEQLQNLGIEVWYQPYLTSFNDFLSTHGSRFKTIMFSRHQVAGDLIKAVRHHCPTSQVIFDTVDLHYLREQREATLKNSHPLQRIAEQTKHKELSMMRASDLTLVVSKAEQALLAKEVPECRVEILSNIHEVEGRDQGFEQRSDMMFVGGFQHPPNIDAVQWLVNDIWPIVQQQLPDIRLHIIGSQMPDEITSLASEQVIMHGYVEDLNHFHNHCRISLAPLRYGAGVKGKINSAMSYGLPVVATALAVEGMSLHHEQQVLVGETASELASAIVRLYCDADLWLQLSDAGLENIKEHFSMQAAATQLQSFLA